MKKILQAYQSSLADSVFSRKEKQAIIQMLEKQHLDKHDLARLRSQIFDIARTHATAHNIPVILDWLEIANKTLLIEAESQSEVYFSPDDDCAPVIMRQLESATSAIRICVFTISDNRIADTIMQRARDGIRIQIITDDDKTYDYGSDIGRLAASGLEVRVDYTRHHMHHKFAIIDEVCALTGSYNWTRSAEEHNHENLLITREKSVVDAYLTEFKRLWDIMKPYEARG
jgi:mitochondrial cardiolipin hydrolase